jgi:hypothetical protein
LQQLLLKLPLTTPDGPALQAAQQLLLPCLDAALLLLLASHPHLLCGT